MNRNETNQKNQRRGGYYWVELEGKLQALPSVTTILQCTDKPGLNYWKQKMVYQAMVQNPGLTEQEALAAPIREGEKAKGRGTTVHSVIEVYKGKGELIEATPAIQPFVDAFRTFSKEHPFTVLEQERTVYNARDRYAGTLDLLIRTASDEVRVVDIKTGKARGQIYPEYHLQVSAYVEALKSQGVQVDGGAIALLREDGTYVYETSYDCYEAFKGLKTYWEWLHREDLQKFGL